MAQTSTFSSTSPSTKPNALDIELRRIFQVYSGEVAVCGVNLAVHQGEFFSILGPSGSGKTTTLRIIAGFETPAAGEVLIQNQLMNHIPAYRRPVNTVFQSYALFNHLNVAENIAFGLRIKKLPRKEIEERVQGALSGVKMTAYAHKFPYQLSGGQQQRVALARALVNRPAVLLLDEPLGALDLKLRKEMQGELSRLHRELGVTFVMVTHDQEEALSLSDRIAVMREGKIEQVGTPSEIYDYPQSPFVADFIGDTNLWTGSWEANYTSSGRVITSGGLKICVCPTHQVTLGEDVTISVRPEKIQLSMEPFAEVDNCFAGRLEQVMYLGTHVQYLVQLEATGDHIQVRQPHLQAQIASDRPVFVAWSAADSLALPERK